MTDSDIIANLTRQLYEVTQQRDKNVQEYRALLVGFQKYMEGGFGPSAVVIDVEGLSWSVQPFGPPPASPEASPQPPPDQLQAAPAA